MTLSFDCGNRSCNRTSYGSWSGWGEHPPVEMSIMSKITEEEFEVIKYIESIVPTHGMFASAGLCGVCMFSLVNTPEETQQAVIDIAVDNAAESLYAAMDRKTIPYQIELNPKL